MAPEQSFDRPDARFALRPEPEWAKSLRSYATGASLVSGIVVFFLIFYLPGFLYGDLAGLLVMGYFSGPAGLVFGQLSNLGIKAWMVRRVNAEVRRPVPERGRAAAPIAIATLISLVVGAGVLVAVLLMPNTVR